MYTTILSGILLATSPMSGCVLKDGLVSDTGIANPCDGHIETPVTLSNIDGPTDHTLDVSFACDDLTLVARSADQRVVVGFRTAEPLLHDAHEQTAIITRTFVVGDGTIDSFILQLGEGVGSNYCSDALSIPTIEASYTAISGKVVVTATPSGEYDPEGDEAEGWVEATLSNVLFEDDTGEQLLLSELSICDRAGYSYP